MKSKRSASACLKILCTILCTHCVYGQQDSEQVQRDSSAIALMRTSVEAAGGMTALLSLRDYEIDGMIVPTGQPNESPQTFVAKAIVGSAYRSERTGGDHAEVLLWRRGILYRKQNGDTAVRLSVAHANDTDLPFMPARILAETLQDESARVVDKGSEAHDGVTLRSIAIYPPHDSRGSSHDSPALRVFIDSTTSQIAAIQEIPEPQPGRASSRGFDLTYSKQQLVNGIGFPFTVTQRENGDTRSETDISQVKVNQGMSETDLSQDVIQETKP